MTGPDVLAEMSPLTRRSGRAFRGRVAPLVVAGVAVALTALAATRLDPVYRQVPGVYASWQLMPLPLEVRYELDAVRRGFGGTAAAEESRETQQEAADVVRLGGALSLMSSDITVRSWREGSGRTVAVGVAEVADAAELVERLVGSGGALSRRELPRRTAARAWAVGDRFVVALTVTARGPRADRAALADARAEQVAASVGLARVVWWETLSLGPFLLLPVVWGFAYVLWIVLWLAFTLLVRVPFYLLVLLPSSLLGLRRRPTPAPPAAVDDPFRGLARGVERVDLDRLGMPLGPGAVAWFTAVVLALAVAIPSLTRSLWTDSLVWGALGAALALVWWGRGGKDPWARSARWAVAAAATVEVANALFGVGPGLPTEGPVALTVAVAVLVGAVVVAWRRAAAAGSLPDYVPWYADADLRAAAYLVGLGGIALAGGALFLGSNGDLDTASQLASKTMAAVGLAVVPFVGRRVRAARDAARRKWARDREVPEVLLLRSFVDDGLKVPSRPRARRGFERLIPARTELFEDVVVRAFTQLGPVVAIARPGTAQTELGASRDLILGADWLTAVKEEMAGAAYVVVILGRGEGLELELETLRELELLDRACLVVPPVEAHDAAERLRKGTAVVDGEEGWGVLSADPREEVLSLVGTGERRFVAISAQRDATAYLRLGAFLADRAPGARV
ncbi:MAG TPA: hypothetical protein VNO56_09670 [Gaiellaceae bacterium]|nr:hypothetical protein [Gaiellaceae bacterium]